MLLRSGEPTWDHGQVMCVRRRAALGTAASETLSRSRAALSSLGADSRSNSMCRLISGETLRQICGRMKLGGWREVHRMHGKAQAAVGRIYKPCRTLLTSDMTGDKILSFSIRYVVRTRCRIH
jgi:hypothetical protein